MYYYLHITRVLKIIKILLNYITKTCLIINNKLNEIMNTHENE